MQIFEIEGGCKLFGKTRLQGAKNSVLPLLSASLLTEDEVTIKDCPNLLDIENMLKILSSLGVRVERKDDCIITSGRLTSSEIPPTLAKEMRSSVFLLGSILAMTKRAKTAFPGGCAIGERPIDLHINGLRKLGVKIDESAEFIECTFEDSLLGSDIYLDKQSVGATENLLLSSVLAKGKTVLRNVALEPEVVDLIHMLKAMGADIVGEGGQMLTINGVESLHGVEFTPIPDRIVAGTLIVAVAMCGGDVLLENCNVEHIKPLIHLLKDSCNFTVLPDSLKIESSAKILPIKETITSPYPGFPTDMQAQLVTMLTQASGVSLVIERIFENRFCYVEELRKLGADIDIVHDIAVIKGGKKLRGTCVKATDLRGGSALVLAGLCAEGKTVVEDIFHIDRGYDSIERVLSSLGAKIIRKNANI